MFRCCQIRVFLPAASALMLLQPAFAGTAGASGKPSASPYHALIGYPQAHCNDQHPAVYYFRPATDSRLATRWLFYLEGGGECNSDTTNDVGLVSCQDRYNTQYSLLTAKNWKSNVDGILSTSAITNPDFAKANVVEVHYCSSDYWSGGKAHAAGQSFLANNASTGWDFQGRAIAIAALTDLKNTDSSSHFLSAKQVLFAGSSAGGEGIGVTLNDLRPLLPPTATMVGVLEDAGFALEIKGFDSSPNAQPPYMTDVYNSDVLLANGISEWGGHGDTPCSNMYPKNDIKDQVQCYNTGTFFTEGYYGIPAFVAEAEEDAAQLKDDGWLALMTTASESYLLTFANMMEQQLENTPVAYGAFGPGDNKLHTMFAGNDTFNHAYTFPNTTKTPQKALHDWLGGLSARYFGVPAPEGTTPK